MFATPMKRALRAERWRRNPHLYQVNAATWTARFRPPGGTATLADVPDQELDLLASLGFDLVWLMGVWTKGDLGVRIAREHPEADSWYRQVLPDWRPEDVIGSPFAVAAYRVAPALGGEEALADLRARLAERGIGLVLDFVPNHTSRDHPWVVSRPDLYVGGDPELARRDPSRYFTVETERGPRAIAFGRDPHFAGWTDTAQLNWTRPDVHLAMGTELAQVAGLCDGVRCDMAMLILGEVFPRTWPEVSGRGDGSEFWPRAIAGARRVNPSFLTIAEVYWGLEGRLLELGFDYVYDKELYDRLRGGDVAGVKAVLDAPHVFRRRAVHFIGNHDEEPPAAAFGPREHAAAIIVATLPGMRFFHESQLDGRLQRVPVQLGRGPSPGLDPDRVAEYGRILAAASAPELRDGDFRLATIAPAAGAEGREWGLVAFIWEHGSTAVIVAVNLSGDPAEGRVRLRLLPFGGRSVVLEELPTGPSQPAAGDELLARGHRIALGPYASTIVRIRPAEPDRPA